MQWIKLPEKVYFEENSVRYLRDMHRVHHSIIVGETNSNFGFSLPWWDWLFGSYRAQPRDGHLGMTIGLREWRDPAELGLWSLLRIPFVNRKPGRTP